MENEPKPIGWSLISGSGTSNGNHNPAFVVVEWDEEYMVPVNIITYYMNLTEANLTPDEEPKWRVLHNWLDEYKLKDLSPSSMIDLTLRLYNDAELASQFNWNLDRRGSPKKEAQLHSQSFICMNSSEAFEKRDCYGKAHIDLHSTDSADWFNFLIANWIKI